MALIQDQLVDLLIAGLFSAMFILPGAIRVNHGGIKPMSHFPELQDPFFCGMMVHRQS